MENKTMTHEQFIEIVKTADQEEMARRLKEQGYIFCNKETKLGNVGIVELVQAVIFETEDFADEQHKHLYNGRICEKVNGYESYEFVYINVFDIKQFIDPFDDEESAIQTAMLIWAREI